MYDVVVVGARCAGATTAMLLARAGHRVLLLDRAPFPSDTLSTHFIWHPGVALLARWGLLDRVRSSGCPPIDRIRYEIEDVSLAGPLPSILDAPFAYAPRRVVLDPILAEAAVAAGAEFHDRSSVTGLTYDGERVSGVEYRRSDGTTARVHARLVVGADGRYSAVARWVGAEAYHEYPSLTVAYWSYWDGAEAGLELYVRNRRMVGVVPTNHAQTMVAVYFPQSEFHQVRTDPNAYRAAIRANAPGLSDRLDGGRQVQPLLGVGQQPNFFRRAAGPGWVLVGDAGHHKDSLPAWGITDAFSQSALLAECLDGGLDDPARVDASLREFARLRDESMLPGYQQALHAARLSPEPVEIEFARAVQGDPELTDRFFALSVGVGSFEELAALVAERTAG